MSSHSNKLDVVRSSNASNRIVRITSTVLAEPFQLQSQRTTPLLLPLALFFPHPNLEQSRCRVRRELPSLTGRQGAQTAFAVHGFLFKGLLLLLVALHNSLAAAASPPSPTLPYPYHPHPCWCSREPLPATY
jgi:hypothetical protein